MPSHPTFAASAPHAVVLQADRLRRRIAASTNVAELLANLAFGPPRDDCMTLAGLVADRVASTSAAPQ